MALTEACCGVAGVCVSVQVLDPGVVLKSTGVDSGEDACEDACDAMSGMSDGCSVSEGGGVEIRARLKLGSLDESTSVSVCVVGSVISMSEVSASLAESFSVSVDARWFGSGVSWGGFRSVCCWSLFSVCSGARKWSFLGQSRTTWSGEAQLRQSFG